MSAMIDIMSLDKSLAYFKGHLHFADHTLQIIPYGFNLQVLIKFLYGACKEVTFVLSDDRNVINI